MKISDRTRKLLAEAMVLAYVEGVQHGRFGDPGTFPRDSEIIERTLVAAVVHKDRFPTLAKLDDAQAVYDAHRERTTEMFKTAMETLKNSGS